MRDVKVGDRIRVIKSSCIGEFDNVIGKVVKVIAVRAYNGNADDVSIEENEKYVLRKSDGEWELVDFTQYAEQIINYENRRK